AANIRLDCRAATEGQEANRRGDGSNAELEVLDDFAAVVVDEVAIDRSHGSRIVADADAGLEIAADAVEPLAAEGPVIEVVDLEGQVVQVREQHVAIDAAVLAVDHEVAHVETYQV